MKTMKLFLGLAVLTLVSTNALAQSPQTSNLSVTATVADNCTISTNAVAFGAYDPIVTNKSAALDGAGTVTITCTNNASAAVRLGQGSNADTGSTDAAPLRRMADGSGNFLSYSLFSDSGRTTIWANDANTDVERTGTGAADALSVFGRVAADQQVPAGSYSDTVVASVVF